MEFLRCLYETIFLRAYENHWINKAKAVDITIRIEIIITTCFSLNRLLYVIRVTKLLLCLEYNFSPSKLTLALFLKTKIFNNINNELIMYGTIERTRVCSIFATKAKEAKVIPTAKDPVFPTKIFPRKLKYPKIA